jgi:hypothetical protein
MSRESDLDNVHGDTVVSVITIKMRRNGIMSVEGSITDEVYARCLLDTARDTLTNYHIQQKLGKRSPIIVPAYDTALVGTDAEKKLLAARDELSNAMAKE